MASETVPPTAAPTNAVLCFALKDRWIAVLSWPRSRNAASIFRR